MCIFSKDEAIDVFHGCFVLVVRARDTQGFSIGEGICLIALILGNYRSFINPPLTQRR
jgi:hypothetical protein